jgi:dTDP-4-dehydrorhamnose reductase
VVRQATARGWTVTGTYLSRRPECEAIRLDVRDEEAVAQALRTVRPDRVIHTAYVQSDDEVTRDGAVHVAVATAALRARLVHLSTDVVFSGRLGRPYRERDATDPVTDYGRAKADAERTVAAAAPGAAIVRTSLLVPGRHEEPALKAAAGDAPYPFFTDELRCPIAVEDAAAAVIEVAHLPLSGPIHVAGADAVSRHELACLIARSHGRPVEAIPAANGAAEAGRPADCRLDSGLARSVLQTRLRGVRELLKSE